MIRGLNRRSLRLNGILRLVGCLLALGILLPACSGGGGGGGGSTTGGGTGAEQIAFSGTAMLLDDSTMGFTTTPSTSSGITVTVSSDIDANGDVDSTERASATTDSEGGFSINAPVKVGTRATVSFEEEGYATQLIVVDVNSLSAVSGVDATLSKLRELNNTGTAWKDRGNTVSVSDIDIASGSARAFNPVTEGDRFPGEFADDQGNMLVSGVFAAFDLRDGNGRAVRAVSASNPATVRMKIPRDTWGVLKDLDTSTPDVIDVPMYYFDEETGEWVREGTGSLEDGDGTTIDAATLATITSSPPTFTGSVYAKSQATHFSYWNVDYPVETHACVSGTITDAAGDPVAGASVTIAGISYAGSSSAVLTDASGTFCVDVLRNEDPGEDLDGDGMTGETQDLSMTVRSGSKLYRLASFSLTSGAGSCPTGCMTQDLQLTASNEVQIDCCEVTGTIYDPDGTPVSGATVFAYDETIDSELLGTYCTGLGSYFGISDATGLYDVSSEIGTNLKLYATHSEVDGDTTYYYMGQRSLPTCPSTSRDISTEMVYCARQLTVAVSGQVISWTPDTAVNMLTVMDITTGTVKWMIYSESGFTSPVTFGTAPAAATEQTAASGTLNVLDRVMVSGFIPGSGSTDQCFSNGMYPPIPMP